MEILCQPAPFQYQQSASGRRVNLGFSGGSRVEALHLPRSSTACRKASIHAPGSHVLCFNADSADDGSAASPTSRSKAIARENHGVFRGVCSTRTPKTRSKNGSLKTGTIAHRVLLMFYL